MKIKTKKEMNLPQLIEWGFENDVTNTWYRASNVEEYISEVFFDATGLPQFSNTVNKNDTFTVEIEEEITEETIIPKMLVVGRFDGYEEVYNQKLINFTQHLLSAYIIHDGGHMELIYDEEKGLVE